MTAFTLAHLSDPHLGPLPEARLSELIGKRAIGYVNWMRNRKFCHSRDIVDALVADMRAQSPDHIAVTGDLVNIALEAEFAPARDWLRTVGSPHDVTLVPGNHDAYVGATFPRCAHLWSDYMRGDGDAVAMRFPFLRRRGPLTLISVSTAVPTAPLMATGRLGQEQVDGLATLLSQQIPGERFRVLLIHHPLRSSPRRRHKRLTDSVALQTVLHRYGVELILHGHDHQHSLMWFDGPSGQIPAIGVPSASAIIDGKQDPAAYNLFRVTRENDAWRCEWTVRGFQNSRKEISELRQQRLM